MYQIYPRSFADNDGDGIGDLQGIISHLDHVVGLGFDAVWLSPFFASPQRDGGYDVSDYCDVAAEYGTLDDAKRLIEEAHARGLRVLLDLVFNHTSDQHPWFVESRRSRTGPKADWYIWRDGRGPDGRLWPNNWRSELELRTAWQWEPARHQWFLARFLPFQPDLNWRHPEVREAMFDVVRFWLRLGVDGFRLDMFGAIMKDPEFRSNRIRPRISDNGIPTLWDRRYSSNTDDSFQLARDLRAVCDEFGDRALIGEVFGRPELLRRYVGDGDGLTHVFLFDFLAYHYDASFFRSRIERYEEQFPAPVEPTYVLENHDRARLMSRIGADPDKARVLALLLLTLRGLATVYQGQEIGMTNTRLPLHGAKDPIPRYYFRWLPEAVARRSPEILNRDEVRTPMQWGGSPGAGFSPPGSTAAPWLPVNGDATVRNVARQEGDSRSLLALYRALLHLRRDRPALRSGSLTVHDGLPADVLGYRRQIADDGADVYINFSDVHQQWGLPADQATGRRAVILATGPGVVVQADRISLPPNTGAVLTTP